MRAALPGSAPLNATPHRNCDCVSGIERQPAMPNDSCIALISEPSAQATGEDTRARQARNWDFRISATGHATFSLVDASF